MRRALLLATLAVFLIAPQHTHYRAHQDADPALCEDCKGDYSRLDGWNRVQRSGGTLLILGVARGYLWTLRCDHCSRPDPLVIERGPYAGQEFELVGTYDGKADRPQSATGNRLDYYAPATGETLPDWDFISFYAADNARVAPAGHEVVYIGAGGSTHPTNGWFLECNDEIQRGCVDADADTICEPEEIPACCDGCYHKSQHAMLMLTLETSPHSCPANTGGRAGVFPGGSGELSSCLEAGLTYLGSYSSSANSKIAWGATTISRAGDGSGDNMYLESKNHAGTTAVGGTGGSPIPPWPPTYEFLPDSTGVVGRSGDSGSAVFCKEPEPGEWRFCGLGVGLRTTAWMPPWRTWVRFRINSTPER